jgi:hypothetical protein
MAAEVRAYDCAVVDLLPASSMVLVLHVLSLGRPPALRCSPRHSLCHLDIHCQCVSDIEMPLTARCQYTACGQLSGPLGMCVLFRIFGP